MTIQRRYRRSVFYVVLPVSGVHFPTHDENLPTELSRAVRVFLEGLQQLAMDEGNEVVLSPHLSCEGRGDASWKHGDKFFRSVPLSQLSRYSAGLRAGRSEF
jgi:hypothetical protein